MVKSKSNLLVCIFFGIISVCKAFNLNQNSLIYVLLFSVGTALLLFKIASESYTLREIAIIIILITVCCIIALVGHNLTPLYFGISVSCLKNANLQKIIKVIFITKLISVVIMIFLSSTGLIENNVLLFYRDGIGYMKRYCFGYLHPNIPHMHFLVIIMMFYYLYFRKTNIYVDILLLIINYLLYLYTLSRTSFFLAIIFIVYIIIKRFWKKCDRTIAKFTKYIFLVFFALSILLAYLWGVNHDIRVIDQILTGRIYYCFKLLYEYSIPLIGGNFYSGAVFFDNSYFSLLYQCGIIFTILITFLTVDTVKVMYKKQMYNEIVVMAFMCILSLLENIYITPVINFTILFLSYSIFKAKSIENN